MAKMCNICKTEKDESLFRPHRNKCRECLNAKQRADRKAHPEKLKEYRAKSFNVRKSAVLKYRYGIDLADYERMFTAQGGRCAICWTVASKLCVDHDHETGAVRALLCSQCNKGLGNFKDSADLLVKAAEYVDVFKGEHNE